MDEIEALLGVRPVPGGRHSQFGTHNALLSFGPDTYLEVMARDPSLSAPQRGRLVDLADDQASRLVTWVLRVDDLAMFARSAAIAASGIGKVESGSREQSDGTLIEWQLTDPYAMPLDGAVPFLISWGDTTHPARIAQDGGTLVGFQIEHPLPGLVREELVLLGTTANVVKADEFRLLAQIQTSDGVKSLI